MKACRPTFWDLATTRPTSARTSAGLCINAAIWWRGWLDQVTFAVELAERWAS